MSTPPDLPDTTDLPAGSGLGGSSSDLPGAGSDLPGVPRGSGGPVGSDGPRGSGGPVGSGPLADPGTITGGPIDDPALADRANPRWNEGVSPEPDAPPIGGAGVGVAGGQEPGVAADVAPRSAGAIDGDGGTPQDQAAQELDGQLQVGRDNIREGRGDTVSNPALAEGGDNG